MQHFVYGLVCPECARIMYIGQSLDPEARLNEHLDQTGQSAKDLWLQELQGRGKRPILVLLESCSRDKVDVRERYWIEFFKTINRDLKNTRYAYRYPQKALAPLCKEPHNRGFAYVDIPPLLARLAAKTGKSYTQRELAQKIGVSRQGLLRHLNYKASGVELDFLTKLLDFFAAEGMPITVSDLFSVSDNHSQQELERRPEPA